MLFFAVQRVEAWNKGCGQRISCDRSSLVLFDAPAPVLCLWISGQVTSTQPSTHRHPYYLHRLYIPALSLCLVLAIVMASSSSSPEVPAPLSNHNHHHNPRNPSLPQKLKECLEDLSRLVPFTSARDHTHTPIHSRFILNLPEVELASLERVCFQVEQASVYPVVLPVY